MDENEIHGWENSPHTRVRSISNEFGEWQDSIRMVSPVYVYVIGWLIYVCMDGWMYGWIDVWMDRWMDGG
jgi:hypothetical protein